MKAGNYIRQLSPLYLVSILEGLLSGLLSLPLQPYLKSLVSSVILLFRALLGLGLVKIEVNAPIFLSFGINAVPVISISTGEGLRSVINECLLWLLLLGIALLSPGDCCLPHSVGKSIPSQSMPGKGTMRKAFQEYIHLEIGHLDRPIPIASCKLPGSRLHCKEVNPKPLLEAISLTEVTKAGLLDTHAYQPEGRSIRMVVDQAILLRGRNPLSMPFHFQGALRGTQTRFLSLAHSVAPSSARTKTKATTHFFLFLLLCNIELASQRAYSEWETSSSPTNPLCARSTKEKDFVNIGKIGKDSASTAPPGLSQPGELEEDIWPRIEEATRERFHRLALRDDQLAARGKADRPYTAGKATPDTEDLYGRAGIELKNHTATAEERSKLVPEEAIAPLLLVTGYFTMPFFALKRYKHTLSSPSVGLPLL
ncbi:LOW QUALITY PROTEIN: hypothetical protein NC651_028515 [Populus alba x Populus x berolinensis]|nr:LOW QUALITY PROTEIN: hypothetical protein NC651_028515 [Populus alba x Populus x berolinensis]